MNTYNTDKVMEKIWLCLVSDFRSVLGMDYARTASKVFLDSGVKGLRGYKFPYRSQAGTTIFKCDYQLENLFKRYKFENDVYTEEYLESKAKNDFEATQMRISEPLTKYLYGFKVLQEARKIVSSVLGEYDLQEHIDLCSFGRRSCVGTPYAESYLDVKLSRPLTGSKDHISWFHDNVVKADPLLERMLKESLGQDTSKWYQDVDTLKLTLAPKSWKAYRTILADTLIGSYYTNGLGKVLSRRLRRIGLNIRSLQMKHRDIAQQASKNLKLVTADLSAASDSVTMLLLRHLLPSKWYSVVKYGRIDQIMIDKRQIKLSTAITMGLGHTFPLQTLVFYSLIKAVGKLATGKDVFVSVYGDDLIYPTRIHRYVKGVFRDFHLNMNMEKTYADDPFRESCGGDYHRGFDVRPYQPEGEFKLLSRDEFADFLYKLYNGLTRRWVEVEIPQTLEYLESLLILTKGIIFQVPPSFPDGSGIKVDRPVVKYFYCPINRTLPNNNFSFPYLKYVADFRSLSFLGPYYWTCLNQVKEAPSPWMKEVDRPILSWKFSRKKKKDVIYQLPDGNGTFTIPDVPPKHPVVASKTSGRFLQQTGTVNNWV